MDPVDLSGTWRAASAVPERRRRIADPDLDETTAEGWSDLVVPGHWRADPAFATLDGPVLHRRRFDLEADDAAGTRRWWLVLDGVFYQGDVWLDGRYLGDTEGYFFPHTFEATPEIATGGEHLLAIEVACSPQNDRTAKRNLTGAFQHATWLEPEVNPGGIWRPVRLESSGSLRIKHARVRCLEADARRAVLGLRAVIDAASPTSGTLRTTVAPPTRPADGIDHEVHQVLAAGENRIEWTIEVRDPDLWWPAALGEAPLYDVAFTITDDAEPDAPSDSRSLTTGLRSLRLDDAVLRVNGERLFLKGTNLGPTRQLLGQATVEEIEADVNAAADLGFDMVRVHAHVSRPELYDAADRRGIVVWQDLPLQWSYGRGVRGQALRQAREAVDLLAHHPSIAFWCAHSDPLPGGLDRVGRDAEATRSQRWRRAVGQTLPSWNTAILDPSIRRTLRTVDGTRPVVSSSGLLPQLPRLDGFDSHLWFGWEYGEPDDLADLAARWPRLVRFVSEFGAQSVPDADDFCAPDDWPRLDWDRLAAVHGARIDLFRRVVDPAAFDSFDAWRQATQRYQAELLRRQIETLRLLKYRPTGGFAQFLLADAHPAISASLFDHERRPKLAADAVRHACRPVVVVASSLPRAAAPARSVPFDVHVVSDLRTRIDGVTVSVALEGAQPWTHRWSGPVAADSCTFIGSIELPTPDRVGPCLVRLEAVGPDGALLATNRYELDVID
ncbi:MAG: glycoside hydrolase family 2 protein [Acidimicrobiales bacterium]